MEYKELSTLYHMDNSPDRASRLSQTAESRRHMPSSFDLGVTTPCGPLFVAMPREMTVLHERILRAERTVSSLMESVPPIAQSALARSLVLDEVVSSNAIEDIHSTRDQIKSALQHATGSAAALRRFKEFARLYLELSQRNHIVPQVPQDIRSIYDKVMDGELGNSSVPAPDGAIFRKGGVSITSGGVKVIHTGLEPESRIIESMEHMLRIVQSEDLPKIISAIASHYLFEYAHPFYDGNGRTGRYLLSLFLSESLSMPTVLCLSRTIAENRNLYYKAFKTAEDPLNRGELTFFVYNLMQLIQMAQTRITEYIMKSRTSFELAKMSVRKMINEEQLSDKGSAIIFALVQYSLFGMFGDASLDEIASDIGLGRQMARKHLKKLEEKELIEKVSARPVAFALSEPARRRLNLLTRS